jgi:hypothetical protein
VVGGDLTVSLLSSGDEQMNGGDELLLVLVLCDDVALNSQLMSYHYYQSQRK